MKSRKISLRLPMGLYEFMEGQVIKENTTISKWIVGVLEKAQVAKEAEVVENLSEPKEREVEWSFFLMFVFIVAVLYALFRKVINA